MLLVQLGRYQEITLFSLISSDGHLQVPEAYTFSRAPIYAEEVVVTGFGRGSKQMGVPTANLKPDSLFSGPLKELPLGVYFGCLPLSLAFAKLCLHTLPAIVANSNHKGLKGLRMERSGMTAYFRRQYVKTW